MYTYAQLQNIFQAFKQKLLNQKVTRNINEVNCVQTFAQTENLKALDTISFH